MDGLEDLAKEVEEWNEDGMDDTVTRRFNPCLCLAQFLMRNNPLYLNNAEKYENNQILRREHKRRIINENKPKLMTKITDKLSGTEFPVREITRIFIDIDELIGADGKLLKKHSSLPEVVNAKDISTTYSTNLLYKDLMTYFLSDDEQSADEMSEYFKSFLN